MRNASLKTLLELSQYTIQAYGFKRFFQVKTICRTTQYT